MDTDAILALLQDVAEQVITPRFRSLASGEIHEKAPGDLVTDADREAEQLITAALLGAYPDAAVLGEEAFADDPGLLERYAAAEHAFTVDPVDGTRNFVHGSPDHAVMVAELRRGVVVRSWIWQPQHELAYVAELGAGSFCNGRRLATTPPAADPTTWQVACSRRSWVGRELPGVAPLELSWACCGVDFPRFIEGLATALVYYSTKPWDHAPGQLILTEAGGVLRTHDGLDYDPRSLGVGGLVAAPDAATHEVLTAHWDVTATWR